MKKLLTLLLLTMTLFSCKKDTLPSVNNAPSLPITTFTYLGYIQITNFIAIGNNPHADIYYTIGPSVLLENGNSIPLSDTTVNTQIGTIIQINDGNTSFVWSGSSWDLEGFYTYFAPDSNNPNWGGYYNVN